MHLERRVKLMARKKIIFVIVEGPSDESALGVMLARFFNSKTVYIHILRHDITTKTGNNPSNIINKVCAQIKKYAKENNYKNLHFAEIIHIVDTDGAFIPDELIIENKEISQLIYSETNIQAPDKMKIEQRNQQKRGNIHKLKSVAEIWKLPYRIYYMSCNLDHVLYNKINSTDEEKENDAYQFVLRYRDDLEGFLDYITTSEFSVALDYKESWRFIEEDNHSLKRNSNLELVFENKEGGVAK